MSRKIAKNLSWGKPLNFQKLPPSWIIFLNATTLERVDKTKRDFHHNLSFLFYMVHQP